MTDPSLAEAPPAEALSLPPYLIALLREYLDTADAQAEAMQLEERVATLNQLAGALRSGLDYAASLR